MHQTVSVNIIQFESPQATATGRSTRRVRRRRVRRCWCRCRRWRHSRVAATTAPRFRRRRKSESRSGAGSVWGFGRRRTIPDKVPFRFLRSTLTIAIVSVFQGVWNRKTRLIVGTACFAKKSCLAPTEEVFGKFPSDFLSDFFHNLDLKCWFSLIIRSWATFTEDIDTKKGPRNVITDFMRGPQSKPLRFSWILKLRPKKLCNNIIDLVVWDALALTITELFFGSRF